MSTSKLSQCEFRCERTSGKESCGIEFSSDRATISNTEKGGRIVLRRLEEYTAISRRRFLLFIVVDAIIKCVIVCTYYRM